MASLRRSKSMPTDGATAKFLYTILKQLDLKSIDWSTVADQLDITNGHAARMRFSRFKQHMEGIPPSPRKPRQTGPNRKNSKFEMALKPEAKTLVKKEADQGTDPMPGVENTIKLDPALKEHSMEDHRVDDPTDQHREGIFESNDMASALPMSWSQTQQMEQDTAPSTPGEVSLYPQPIVKPEPGVKQEPGVKPDPSIKSEPGPED